jgi:hypothetical protein
VSAIHALLPPGFIHRPIGAAAAIGPFPPAAVAGDPSSLGAMTQPEVVGAPEHLNGGHDIAAFK